jgi:hypothetical protein
MVKKSASKFRSLKVTHMSNRRPLLLNYLNEMAAAELLRIIDDIKPIRDEKKRQGHTMDSRFDETILLTLQLHDLFTKQRSLVSHNTCIREQQNSNTAAKLSGHQSDPWELA